MAPETTQSGMSQAITMYNPLYLRCVRKEEGLEVYAFSGTPVDCVKMAFDYLLREERVDLVISGINHGSNSAVNVLYSGTMGAAIEGSFYGCPAVGLSLDDHGEERSADQREIIDNTTYVIDEAIRSLREISNNLSPHVLNDFGLARGVQNFIDKSAAMHDAKIRFTTNLRTERYDTDIEVILYRVICELINNSLKHAACTSINLSLSQNGSELALDYTDDGRGFNPQAMMDCGMGLSNISSRINSLGGTFDISSAKGKGMRAAIRVNTQQEPATPKRKRRNR